MNNSVYAIGVFDEIVQAGAWFYTLNLVTFVIRCKTIYANGSSCGNIVLELCR